MQNSRAYREAPAAEEKLQTFLSEVVGIDLAQYNITNVGSGINYPSMFGGLVKEEGACFYLESNGSKISVHGTFYNGLVYSITVYPMEGSIIYTQQPSTNAPDETRNILQRYQAFAKIYGIDASHLTPAVGMLSSVKSSSLNTTLNTLNNITGFVPSVRVADNVKQVTTQTGVKWIYTDKGVDMPDKCTVIDFGGNELLFVDTWNLYTVGCFSVISEDEAVEIAFAAAKSYNLTLIGENDTLIPVQPDWTNMTYTITLNMIPGQIYNDEVNKATHFVNPGNATRDPLALYPLWETVFYFSKSIGNTVGIAVGVWGDIKEIAYLTPYGYLGGSGVTPPTPTETSNEPTVAPSEAPTELENSNPSASLYLTGVAAAVAITIAAAALALKKRSK
ncbi:MAG: hypothetical protein NWE94_08225 [Candidatus Bathyarchaeota archaeon]|nr:hypothetical protein [Candidatus Bathyarchaeota archaeon]